MNETPVPGPNVIGATGGSGTRVIAAIARAGGMFIGTRLNDYEDAVEFGAYSDRWINAYLDAEREPAPSVEAVMAQELDELVASHLSDLPSDARCWGWKEPRSIYLLPFLRQRLPDLRFLHVVRDGRDMAYSANQQQLMKHGAAVLRRGGSRRRPIRSIALWNRVNVMAADYGEEVLGVRYLLVRFEDLCADPVRTTTDIFAFLGLEGDVEEAARQVEPPRSLGRWRRRRWFSGGLEREAESGLRRFEYI